MTEKGMKVSILTLFPEMFVGVFDHSILKRAQDKKLLNIEYMRIRDFGIGPHKVVDDTPYGGGVGMVLRVDVIEKALEKAKCRPEDNQPLADKCNEWVILTDARGTNFTQQKAQELKGKDHLIFICGHYEAIDERVSSLIDERISIGNYVLTGGEIPTMVMTDAIARLIPNVLKKDEATKFESFSKEFYLEHPHYTKPRTWKGNDVPEILLSGDHKKIQDWKDKNSSVKKPREG